VPPDVRTLIRELSTANPLWGAPRLHGELLKLGISLSQSTVAKYMRRHPRPPSQTWRTFLTNHASQTVAADLFVVPTVTFRLLFVLIILAHDRRRIVHMAVTEHPTAAWTAQQLRNAFPGTRPASDVKPPTRWRHWPVQRCPSLLQQGFAPTSSLRRRPGSSGTRRCAADHRCRCAVSADRLLDSHSTTSCANVICAGVG
jgi:hypothetical protein